MRLYMLKLYYLTRLTITYKSHTISEITCFHNYPPKITYTFEIKYIQYLCYSNIPNKNFQ